jgi:hypothetical protein
LDAGEGLLVAGALALFAGAGNISGPFWPQPQMSAVPSNEHTTNISFAVFDLVLTAKLNFPVPASILRAR